MNAKRAMRYYTGETTREEYIEDLDESIISGAKSLETEARLLRIFDEAAKGINSLKYAIAGNNYYGDNITPEKTKEMQDDSIELKKKLRTIANEKMEIFQDIVNGILGKDEKPEPEEKEEDGGE